MDSDFVICYLWLVMNHDSYEFSFAMFPCDTRSFRFTNQD